MGDNKLRPIAGALVASLFLSSVGCAPQNFETESSSNVGGGQRGPASVSFGHSKAECQFVGPTILSDRIKSLLGITSGDVPVLNDQGTATSTMRLASNRTTLGQGDIMAGRPDDFSCSTTKFKASIEIMTDACTIAMQNTTVKSKLFPSGLSNFDELYRSLVGRAPTSHETTVLSDLVKAIPGAKAEAAACAAVASSFESLIRI